MNNGELYICLRNCGKSMFGYSALKTIFIPSFLSLWKYYRMRGWRIQISMLSVVYFFTLLFLFNAEAFKFNTTNIGNFCFYFHKQTPRLMPITENCYASSVFLQHFQNSYNIHITTISLKYLILMSTSQNWQYIVP